MSHNLANLNIFKFNTDSNKTNMNAPYSTSFNSATPYPTSVNPANFIQQNNSNIGKVPIGFDLIAPKNNATAANDINNITTNMANKFGELLERNAEHSRFLNKLQTDGNRFKESFRGIIKVFHYFLAT